MPIEILYAGTGPFAPLAIPLMGRLSPGEVRFTLMDIHPRSVEAVRTLIDSFGFNDYVRECVTADATSYAHPAGEPLHIVVVEAMQRALSKEPHVAIVRSLVPQLQQNGILIPERVSVELVLADLDAGAKECVLATLVELTAASADRLPPVFVEVPELPENGRYVFACVTSVNVFGSHTLRGQDTGLTYPDILWDLAPVSGQRLAFQYVMGSNPGLRWNRH